MWKREKKKGKKNINFIQHSYGQMNWNIIIISNIILAKFKECMYRNLSYFKSTPWIKEILYRSSKAEMWSNVDTH